MSSRPRYIDLLCRGVVKGVVVFTQRRVLVRGSFVGKVRVVWMRMVCALSSRFRAQAFGDLTGGSRMEGVTIMKILRILQSSWRPGVCFFSGR